MQYRATLPLADREVVLTFDDGPLPPYSDHVLAASGGRMREGDVLSGRTARPRSSGRGTPDLQRRSHDRDAQPEPSADVRPDIGRARAEHEIDDGIASVAAALGDAKALAPFFRIPGLLRTTSVEAHLRSRSLVVWSSDTLADDWRPIKSDEVLRLALSRLEAHGKGVLLLHDIQARTVLMLPTLLAELKRAASRSSMWLPKGRGRCCPRSDRGGYSLQSRAGHGFVQGAPQRDRDAPVRYMRCGRRSAGLQGCADRQLRSSRLAIIMPRDAAAVGLAGRAGRQRVGEMKRVRHLEALGARQHPVFAASLP